MLKHIYRLIACVFCFALSVMYFSKNINEQYYVNNEASSEMAEATFPLVNFVFENCKVNQVTGYSANLNANAIRDGMIPVGENQKVTFQIKENKVSVKKASYEVTDLSGEVVEKGSINALNNKKDYLGGSFIVENPMTNGREYCLKLTVISDKGDRIYYYVRLMRQDTSHVSEMLKFATTFHSNIIDKSKANNVIKNIEPDSSMDNKSLAYVNIHSSLDLISFGSLNPKVVSQIYPTFRELTDSTAIIELSYYIEADAGSGMELYKVNEGYRVRWTSTRMYLLHYERNMEAVFDFAMASLAKSELKLGITSKDDVHSIVSADESKLAFVRSNELYYYNLAINSAYRVFSFRQSDSDYVRDVNDKHGIKLLNMDPDGNIKFMVYGYMNRGEYEGRLAIVLYEYYSTSNTIEEMVYIPVDLPYDKLKDQINEFAYMNNSQVYYFTVNNIIYQYNIVTKKLEKVATNISKDNMVMPQNSEIFAWQESGAGHSNVLNVMNMESGQRTEIKVSESKCIRLLGTIGANIIYGVGNVEDYSTLSDGTSITPLSIVYIADAKNNILKTINTKGTYVTSATTDETKICLERVKKDDDGRFVAIDDDYIYNNDAYVTTLKTSSRVTEKAFTEYYLKLPTTMSIPKKPETNSVSLKKNDSENVLRIDLNPEKSNRYYVYSFNGLEAAYDLAGDAIAMADERMGLVFDNQDRKIWERGATDATGQVASISELKASKSDSATLKRTAMKIILAHAGIDVELDKLSTDKPITDVLNEYLDRKAINLSGASLEEVLYYVSSKTPVLAMRTSTKPVILTAYNEYHIKFYDISTGKYETMTRTEGDKMFKAVGNIFISYTR